MRLELHIVILEYIVYNDIKIVYSYIYNIREKIEGTRKQRKKSERRD